MKKIIIYFVFLFIFVSSLNSSPRRVLLEFTTSNTCQYCGCMDSLIRVSTLVQYPQTIILAMHGTIRNPADPYAFFNGWEIKDSLIGPELGFSAPMSFLDRSFWNCTDYVTYRDSLNYRYTNSPVSPIELNVVSKTYNPVSRVFTVTINSRAEQNLAGNYKINFVFIENNLFSFQTGGPCNQQNMNFEHDWVIRNMCNGAEGENLINGNWAQNQVITKTFSYQLDTGWVPSNCEFVAFVYKRESNLCHSAVQQATKGSITGSIGINHINSEVNNFELMQNYPNPFNPVTYIKFSIPKDDNAKLSLYNNLGQEIAVICNGKLQKGIYNAEVDLSDYSSGIYYYSLVTSGYKAVKKMMLLK